MLKSQLIRPRIEVRGNQVRPKILSADYHWLTVAGNLIELFRENVGNSRGQLDEALRDYEGDNLDYPIIRGLADVLTKQADFGSSPPVAPATLREKLFGIGPVTLIPQLPLPKGDDERIIKPIVRRQHALREASVTYKISEREVEAALFADLLEEQVLQGTGDPITPKGLIDRYNLEVARGLLYWAKEVNLRVSDTYRDVFRYIKLVGLMYSIFPNGNGYDITLHGPLSPFVQSTIRYGVQFAKFMPALLLCDEWEMEAAVKPPHADQFLSYQLDNTTELQSYFKGSADFASRLEANFAAEFEQKYTRNTREWELTYEDELITVGDSVMIPDFAFTNKKDGRRALLEIVGFWHPQYLKRKLAKIRAANRSDLIILVYENVKVADGAFEAASAGEVLTFKKKPILKDVIAAVERAAI